MISIAKLFGPKTDLRELIANGALVIDVRTPGEFYEGHYPGSENISLDSIMSSLKDIQRRQKPVITVCRSGARSSAAAAMLKKAGFQAYNGGVWTNLSS